MGNNIYISFTAENSSNDAWVKEFVNFFRITLEKISLLPVNVNSNLDKDNNPEKMIDQANLIIIVFNGFVSDEFSKDLRVLESRHQDIISTGKEIVIAVKSAKLASIIPVYLKKFNQYNFYEVNVRTNENIDYTPLFKGDKENKFWSKLTDLAYDTKNYFEALKWGDNPEKKLTVYLAEVSKDQISHREILRREFLLSGYSVLPGKPIPSSYKDYHDAALELIGKSDVSIHIMGEVYGESPSGSDYSYPEIQNKIVTELLGINNGVKENFYRFVWLPPNLEPYDEKQIQYLKRLKREMSDSKSGEIIQCSIEEFKEIFIHRVSDVVRGELQRVSDPEQKKLVLITDNSEKIVCKEIENRLRSQSKPYEIIDLSQTGELLPPSLFKQKMQMANGAILLNFSQNQSWVQGMLGLTIKNLSSSNTEHKASVAAISSIQNKAAFEYSALKVDFYSLEDSQLLHNIENFLIQLN